MALEDLTQRIAEDAAAQRDRLLDDAKKEGASVREELMSEFAASKEGKSAVLKQENERIRRSIRVTTAMKLRSHELQQRRQLVQEVRERALAQLVALDDTAYTQFLSSRIAELPGNEGQITPAARRKAATEAAVQASGKAFEVIEEDASLQGGFRFVRGDLVIDASLEALLSEFFAGRETDVASQLFPATEQNAN